MQIEQSTLKTTTSGICTVEDGIIYEINSLYGQKTRIGVTDATYNELKSLADEYYKKLVELGAIIPPKTPEEIQAETVQMMNTMMEQMKAMKEELEGLKHERESIGTTTRDEPTESGETSKRMDRSTKAIGKCK